MVRHYIVLSYLFDDIIYRFRRFFQVDLNNLDFLYDVCFGLKPVRFDPEFEDGKDSLILDEEDEVTEMYFFLKGIVGVCYYKMTQGLSKKEVETGIKYEKPIYICDYYVCYDKPSEFIYRAEGNMLLEGFCLDKKFLLNVIFPKYPKISQLIKETSERRYNKNVRNVMKDLRQKHIDEINKQSPYKQIQVREKSGVPRYVE